MVNLVDRITAYIYFILSNVMKGMMMMMRHTRLGCIFGSDEVVCLFEVMLDVWINV